MEKQFDTVRRTDRQETDLGFLHFMLQTSVSCTIAAATDQFPLIHATFFDFDKEKNEVMFHFSKYGFGGQEIQNGKLISISVYKYGKLYTAERAVDFGGEYQSVIIYGKVRIVEDSDERMKAMKTFFNKFFAHIPTHEYKDFTVTEANPIAVIKVKIEKWIGKQHRVPEKAKAAFYPEVSPVVV